ncbi:1-phosphatidylinositol phosphodiesterase-like [Ptychodera flava]|uniref:1-phosphatidylinositol phosphodiesterase-like n=1 Tax=Ptychodera flava TaxID=63121 RepID=UPI00396A6433
MAKSDSSAPSSTRPTWMSNISDSVSLASLSIPGTHNTMTYKGKGGALVRCQTWSLYAQLEAGIRFIDIRCRHFTTIFLFIMVLFTKTVISPRFWIKSLDSLTITQEKTILMRVRKEHTEERNTRSMAETFKSYTSRYNSDYFWTSGSIPNLGAARRKVIILDDFAGGQVGMRYGGLDIDDKWEVRTVLKPSINKKWSSVSDHLKKARGAGSDRIFLTYSSGASGGAYPNAVAARINPKLLSFFNDNRGKWGIVAMDFPGEELISKIINAN